MSFGFGAGDVFLVTTLTWKLYKSCKESSEDFRRMSTELMSLYAVLGETRDYLEEHGEELAESQKSRLSILMHGCQSSLEDLDALYLRYESLSTQAQRSWDRVRFGLKDLSDVRQRLVSSTTLLTSFNTALINSSTSRMEKKLNKFITEVRAGMREGSVMSVSDAATTIESPDVWAELRRELEDVGISADIVEEHHDFIVQWLKNALTNGLLEENARVVGADDASINSLTLITDEGISICTISDEGISIRNLTPTNDVENYPSSSPDVWEVTDQHTPPLLPGALPPVPSPSPRSPSPFAVVPAKPPPQQTLRKKTPPVLARLYSLDPVLQQHGHVRNKSEERPPETMLPREKDKEKSMGGFWWRGREHRDEEKEKSKGGFWGRSSEKDRDRERAEMEVQEREVRQREHREQTRGGERRDEENELTRKIGFLTATASEDWTLVLDVCDYASATEANAKEAVRALRREFKHGEPAVQLAAARLWAIMLRNSSDTFISQSTSRKFLNTLEDLLTSSSTSPVVRERVMDVLAAAAYASGSKKDVGFRGLWRRVKPRDKPEDGIPFDTEDAMFNPPLRSDRNLTYDYDTNNTNAPVAPVVTYPKTDDNSPPNEDMRRLFQECKIGVGNGNLLTQALAMATPEQLGDTLIVELHKKCLDSQELISNQLSWAAAGAERSRKEQEEREERDRARTPATPNSVNPNGNGSMVDLGTPVLTREEELFADLFASNEQLLEALVQYNDFKRVALEREAEDRSRRELRVDPRQQ